jgi:UDP-glucose 4-epimerase
MRYLKMNKSVAVFGGCGFLGSYVVEELLRRGYKVIIPDLKPSKYVDQELFVECDIRDRDRVASIITDEIEYVYNFAGFASLDGAAKKPVDTIELNVVGNLNILEACINKRVKRFVYASSAYALSTKGSFYGISKLSSEKLVEEYYKAFGLEFTIVRYGSVYGERAYSNNYLYNVLKGAINKKEINHDRDGQEIREYIHAFDAATLSVDIIESDNYKLEYFILTGIERMKRIDLFTMISEIMNGDVKINLQEAVDDHHYKITPYSFHPSIAKKLVPNPYIDMGQGILDCIREIHGQSDND